MYAPTKRSNHRSVVDVRAGRRPMVLSVARARARAVRARACGTFGGRDISGTASSCASRLHAGTRHDGGCAGVKSTRTSLSRSRDIASPKCDASAPRVRAPLREPSGAAQHRRLRLTCGPSAWWEHTRYLGRPSRAWGRLGSRSRGAPDHFIAKLSDSVRYTRSTSLYRWAMELRRRSAKPKVYTLGTRWLYL